MRPRLACRRTGFILLLGLLPLVEACLLFSPLDEVSDGAEDDDDVGGAYGGGMNGGAGAAGNGGTSNTGSGGMRNPGAGGNLETGNGGSVGLSGSSGSSGNGGMGGTASAPSDVSSWCPDPVALFAQNNPYTATFTLIETDCPGDPGLTEIEYNVGLDAAPNCTLTDTPIAPDVCGYDEIEICIGGEVDATTTGDVEAYSRIVQLEPGGPIVGATEILFTFYDELGEFILSCSAGYNVIYTPQSAQ